MPHPVRNILRQSTFVSMILLALAVAMLAVPARAETCAPVAEAMAVAGSNTSEPCAPGDCGDCVIACAHGCCHASVLGVPSGVHLSLNPPRFEAPAGWGDSLGIPLPEQAGLLRPPRP